MAGADGGGELAELEEQLRDALAQNAALEQAAAARQFGRCGVILCHRCVILHCGGRGRGRTWACTRT